MSKDEIRIVSSLDGIVPRTLTPKLTAGRKWAGAIRDEILRSVLDRSKSFEEVWTDSLLMFPIPNDAPNDGFSEEKAKFHLEHIWNETRRQLDERGDV